MQLDLNNEEIQLLVRGLISLNGNLLQQYALVGGDIEQLTNEINELCKKLNGGNENGK